MMKKRLAALLAALALCALTACGGTQPAPPEEEPAAQPEAEPSAQPEAEPAAPPEAGSAAEAETLEQLLSLLQAEDVALVGWLVDTSEAPRPSDGEVTAILRNAAGSLTRDRAPLTLDGSATDVIWSLDIYLGDPNAPGWSGDDALYLFAGLEENVVEIFGGANLPEGRVWAEDAALYDMVRTSTDRPDPGVDQAACEKYRSQVDEYLASLPDYSDWPGDVSVRHELTGFQPAGREDRLDAEFYTISTVAIVDPPEAAPHLLAGGAYVDSRLRLHGDGGSTLVVTDGEAIGWISWELPIPDALRGYDTKEALIEAVRAWSA